MPINGFHYLDTIDEVRMEHLSPHRTPIPIPIPTRNPFRTRWSPGTTITVTDT